MEQEKSIFCFFEKRPKYAEQFAEQIKMKTLKALMAKGKLKICAEWVGIMLPKPPLRLDIKRGGGFRIYTGGEMQQVFGWSQFAALSWENRLYTAKDLFGESEWAAWFFSRNMVKQGG